MGRSDQERNFNQLRQYEVFKKLPKGKSAPKGYLSVSFEILQQISTAIFIL